MGHKMYISLLSVLKAHRWLFSNLHYRYAHVSQSFVNSSILNFMDFHSAVLQLLHAYRRKAGEREEIWTEAQQGCERALQYSQTFFPAISLFIVHLSIFPKLHSHYDEEISVKNLKIVMYWKTV
jgi:hypothetical protein